MSERRSVWDPCTKGQESEEGFSIAVFRLGKRFNALLGVVYAGRCGRSRDRGEVVVISAMPSLLQIAEGAGDLRYRRGSESLYEWPDVLIDPRITGATSYPLTGLLHLRMVEKSGQMQLLIVRSLGQ